MRGHIRIDKNLREDPRVLELAKRHGKATVLGTLVLVWSYADTYVRANNRLMLTLPALATELGLSLELLEHFPPEWLRVDADGLLTLPGYVSKNALAAKDHQRQKGCERQRRFRARHTKPVALRIVGKGTPNAKL